MSDNQHIDPALLSEAQPTGLTLRHQPTGIKRINKKGLIFVAGGLGCAAVIAVGTFNQAGSGATDAAKEVVANQGKTNTGRVDFKRDTLWYAQIPDKVQTPEPTLPQAAPAGLVTSTKDGVPDLTGQGVSPLAAATAAKTAAPNLGNQANSGGGSNGSGNQQPQLSPEEQQAQQRALQTQQMKAQQYDQALKAGLAAPNFTQAQGTQTSMAGRPGASGAMGAMGVPQQRMSQPQQREDDQNKQERKDTFLQSARSSIDPDYSSSVKTAPRSPYELKAGAVIPSIMIGGINSDLPGQVIAQVRENVYDSKTGQHLLIPQGSRLIGLYDAHVAYGQKRILLAWNRIVYPNGDAFNLKGMPGADKAGYAGFFDQVDNHYGKVFGSALLMSVISAGVQLSQPNNGGSSGVNQAPSVSQTVGAALGQQIGQTAMTITQKNINIQPTLEVRPGYLFNVMVTADMILPPPGAQ